MLLVDSGIRMNTSPVNGYLALSKGGTGPGVVCLHAWWGLNPFFKDFCERLAAEGFVVFAPDLYHGQVATTIEEAKRLRAKLNQQRAYSDLLKVVDFLHSLETVTSPSTGLIGFSLGARFALELSTEHSRNINPVVVFYGNSNVDYSSSQAAYLGHFAENDEYVALSGVKKLEKKMQAAGRPFTAHIYQGVGHWFFEDDQPKSFNGKAARLAWQRTVDFLNLHLQA
jgi:carboxymethylenebutenolidase